MYQIFLYHWYLDDEIFVLMNKIDNFQVKYVSPVNVVDQYVWNNISVDSYKQLDDVVVVVAVVDVDDDDDYGHLWLINQQKKEKNFN